MQFNKHVRRNRDPISNSVNLCNHQSAQVPAGPVPAAWTLLDVSSRSLPLTIDGMLKNFAGKLYYPQLFDRYLSAPDLAQSNYANVSQTSEENYTVLPGHVLNAYFTSLNAFFAITAGINSDSAYF